MFFTIIQDGILGFLNRYPKARNPKTKSHGKYSNHKKHLPNTASFEALSHLLSNVVHTICGISVAICRIGFAIITILPKLS